MLADALHSVVDSSSNVLVLFISRFASPIPDRDRPYGHLKYDAVGALALAAFLLVACVEIILSAIERLVMGSREVLESRLPARFSPVRVLIHVEPAYKSDRITYNSPENQDSFPQT